MLVCTIPFSSWKKIYICKEQNNMWIIDKKNVFRRKGSSDINFKINSHFVVVYFLLCVPTNNGECVYGPAELLSAILQSAKEEINNILFLLFSLLKKSQLHNWILRILQDLKKLKLKVLCVGVYEWAFLIFLENCPDITSLNSLVGSGPGHAHGHRSVQKFLKPVSVFTVAVTFPMN